MWRGEINNINYIVFIYYFYFIMNVICFFFVKCNIVISMSYIVIYYVSFEYIIFC